MGPDVSDYGVVTGAVETVTAADNARFPVRGFDVVASDRCSGFLDSAAPISGHLNAFTVSGWAWSPLAVRKPMEVLFALPDGNVAGSARTSIGRPDVLKNLPSVKDLEIGWTAEVAVPKHASVREYLQLDDDDRFVRWRRNISGNRQCDNGAVAAKQSTVNFYTPFFAATLLLFVRN